SATACACASSSSTISTLIVIGGELLFSADASFMVAQDNRRSRRNVPIARPSGCNARMAGRHSAVPGNAMSKAESECPKTKTDWWEARHACSQSVAVGFRDQTLVRSVARKEGSVPVFARVFVAQLERRLAENGSCPSACPASRHCLAGARTISVPVVPEAAQKKCPRPQEPSRRASRERHHFDREQWDSKHANHPVQPRFFKTLEFSQSR